MASQPFRYEPARAEDTVRVNSLCIGLGMPAGLIGVRGSGGIGGHFSFWRGGLVAVVNLYKALGGGWNLTDAQFQQHG